MLPVDIATAALHLLTQHRGIDLSTRGEITSSSDEQLAQDESKTPLGLTRVTASKDQQDDRGPEKTPRVPRNSGPRNSVPRNSVPRGQRENEVALFLSIGREAGVRPADIVGALANEVGIPGSDIGRIDLFGRKAFVGLPRSVADRVLAEFPTLLIRGKSIALSLARQRNESAPPWKKPKHRHARTGHKQRSGKGKGRRSE